jgi:diphosphomevalonate decarboxylase
MDRTARTSPYYAAWLVSAEADVVEAEQALRARDLAWLGRIAERSALRMHASAMAAEPAIIYWAPATLAAMETVRRLREPREPRDSRAGDQPIAAYFTIDAGPNVKVLCHAADAPAVAAALAETPGVQSTLVASPGPGAHVVSETAE